MLESFKYLLIKNIRCVFPEQNIDRDFNIFIKDGIIIDLFDESKLIEYSNIEKLKIIESKEDWVCVPGLFDMHVHFRYPGQTHKEDLVSGSLSALNGGFTGVVCMPNTSPAIDNVNTILDIQDNSKNLGIDLYLSAAITKGRNGEELSDLNTHSDLGVVLFTDDGDPVHNPYMMAKAFQYAVDKDLILSQHCEETLLSKGFGMNDCDLSFKLGLKGYPTVAEEVILARDIMLSKYYGKRRYHAQHLSTKGSMQLIENAKNDNLNVSAEVAPHHFSLNHYNLSNYDTNFKMNPPLRSDEDISAIINAIKNGIIDCIATDHAPHSVSEKLKTFNEAPNGILGLETSVGVSFDFLYNKHSLSLNRLIEMMSINPRKLLKINTVKFKIGEKANFTIIDFNKEWTVDINRFKSKSRNSPYNNYKLKGKPIYTINKNFIFTSDL